MGSSEQKVAETTTINKETADEISFGHPLFYHDDPDVMRRSKLYEDGYMNMSRNHTLESEETLERQERELEGSYYGK